jgi:hypothetical protein
MTLPPEGGLFGAGLRVFQGVTHGTKYAKTVRKRRGNLGEQEFGGILTAWGGRSRNGVDFSILGGLDGPLTGRSAGPLSGR